MKNILGILFCLLLIIFISCTSGKKIDFAAEESKIRSLNSEAFEAEMRKDLETIVNIYADYAIIQGPNMPQFEGKEAIKNFYEEFFKLPIVSIEGGPNKIVISNSGDMAYDIGWNRTVLQQGENQIEDKGKYFCVWKKINDEWKIVVISYSSDKQAQ
ncbi:MAG: YybH family protein [Candidatus Aminicenantia bacterium]